MCTLFGSVNRVCVYVCQNVPENVKNFSENEIFALEKFKIGCQMQIHKQSIRAEKEIKLKQMEIGSKGVDDLHRVDVKVNFLPEFVEGEEEDFFAQFEKVARLRKWQKQNGQCWCKLN